MVFSRRSLCAVLLLLTPAALLPPAFAQAASTPAPPAAQQPLLPSSFAGWTAVAPTQTGTGLESADQANADVLKEYGLKDFAVGEYSQGGRHLTLHARRFVDATGAYGAFTFYRRLGMHAEDIGKGAAIGGNEALFWNETTLVDAVFGNASLGASSDSEACAPVASGETCISVASTRATLKELAAEIPPAAGSEGVPPNLPHYLPKGFDPSSVRYSIGPAAYARTGGVLPPALVDFSRDAEAVTAQYTARDGKGTLTLLEYPTPQIAIARAKAIDEQLKQGVVTGGNATALGVHRSGPLVAITSGNFSTNEAQALLASVKYEAEVTWNHPEGYVSEVSKTAKLLLGILYLTGILGTASILLGLFLGGGRALFRRLRGKPVSTLNDDYFISLKLD
ncbi:MAG: DUF6599 family protein [Silvibacterium sp.]